MLFACPRPHLCVNFFFEFASTSATCSPVPSHIRQFYLRIVFVRRSLVHAVAVHRRLTLVRLRREGCKDVDGPRIAPDSFGDSDAQRGQTFPCVTLRLNPEQTRAKALSRGRPWADQIQRDCGELMNLCR